MMERPLANSRSVLNGYDLNCSKRFDWDGWDSVAWAILCWIWGGEWSVERGGVLCIIVLSSLRGCRGCMYSVGRSTWGWLTW